MQRPAASSVFLGLLQLGLGIRGICAGEALVGDVGTGSSSLFGELGNPSRGNMAQTEYE